MKTDIKKIIILSFDVKNLIKVYIEFAGLYINFTTNKDKAALIESKYTKKILDIIKTIYPIPSHKIIKVISLYRIDI